MELFAGGGDPGEVAAVAQVVVGEGVALDEPHDEQAGVLDVLDHRGSDARLRGGLGVASLGIAVDGEQLAPGLRDAYDDRPIRRGHLEVHVGQPAGELLDLALATAQTLDRVEALSHEQSHGPPRDETRASYYVGTMNENETLKKVPTGLFIGGEWRDASDGSTIDVEDPATGETLIDRRVGERGGRQGRAGRRGGRAGTTGPRRRRASGPRSCGRPSS